MKTILVSMYIAAAIHLCLAGKRKPYTLVANSMTYDEALANCEALGMTLVYDVSEETHSAILALIAENNLENKGFWINARRGSSGKFETSSGMELTHYHPWGDKQPNQEGDCVCLIPKYDHDWDDVKCSAGKRSVCGYPEKPSGPIPERDQYKVIKNSRTYDEALAICENIGMTLAYDVSEETHSTILALLEENGISNKGVWANGRRNANGEMVTSNGDLLSAYPYQAWAQNQPNGDGDCLCLKVNFDHQWDDINCDAGKRFVCGFPVAPPPPPARTRAPPPPPTEAPPTEAPPTEAPPTEAPPTEAPPPPPGKPFLVLYIIL
ncbi:uncharacterized protein [Ptychodera flava]|uniref:uncharacterized protein isoform X2 n=1 Tax=Ptychodera flava TaxID=63121 RepID=UPI00396A9470